MRNKVVVWGTNAQNEKVLIAIELKEESNKIVLYTFPDASVTDDFVNKMNTVWKEDKGEVEFPEGYATLDRELSITESLLPDDLKADRPDQIIRAQNDWQLAILSSKLYRAYQDELAEFREKIAGLEKYDNTVFNSLRAFWDKVNGQSRERNLLRKQADTLRDEINKLFEDLKKIRGKVEEEFQEVSKGVFEEMSNILADIEARIEKGAGRINSIMDELKALQARYRNERLSNVHRNQLWDRMDAAFKSAKERKFGPGANQGTMHDHQARRLQGLLEALKRMEDSIRRDEQDLEFQRKKVETSEGQLEAQIRQAKIKIVEERLESKKQSLQDMAKTRTDLERQINQSKERDEKRQRMETAKENVKSEIAAVTKRHPNPATSGAEAGGSGPNVPASQSMLEVLSNVIGESMEDVVDTVKAVFTVAAEKAEPYIDEAREKIQDVADIITKDRSAEAVPEAEVVVENAPEAAPEAKVVIESEQDATPVAEVAVEAISEVEVAIEATPEAEITIEATPEAEITIEATPEAEVTVEPTYEEPNPEGPGEEKPVTSDEQK